MKLENTMKLVRLSSGEEVIGNISETPNLITIKDGFSLIPAGEGRIGFMPFMAYTKAKNGVSIDKRFVMFIVEPQDELVDQIRSMKSGISVPDKRIVT